MAISGGDGSIILTTKVDTSGISKGSLSIRSALQSVDTTVKKVQTSFSAFREQKVTLQTLNQAIKDQQYVLNSLNLEYAEYVARGKASSTEAKQLKSNIDALTVEMREMEAAAATLGSKGSASINKIGVAMKSLLSYFIGIQTIFKVINFSGEAAGFASQTEAGIERLVDIYGEASQVVGDFIDQNARAIGMSRAAAASFAATYGNIFSGFTEQSTNAQLTNEFLNLTAVIASKTGRTIEEVQEKIKSGLFGNLRAIDDLGIFVRQSALIMTDAFKKIADGRSWEQLNNYEQQQVIALAILEQGVNKYGNEVMRTTALTRAQYNAAYQDFQNTWGQVVNKVLIPVLKVLTQVFTIATKGLQIIAGLTGKTIDNSKLFSSQETSIGGAVDNQEALTDAVKGTNKELKKATASFDDIEILSSNAAGNASDTGVTGTSGGVGEIGDLGFNYDNSIVEKISGDMTAIMAIVGGALVAVGLILLFSGHIGWGIGFIIAGASIFAVSMATLSSSDQVTPISEKLMTILGIAGVALTAIGLILLFSGSFLWGIAFIIAGASALSVAVVALKQGKVSEEAEKMLINIMTIAGVAMLALGVILLCFGVVSPLSIGLVVAGAASLAGAIALNPKAVFDSVSQFFKDNAGLIVGISLALLVLGIVLCFCGIVTPLSIGMIVVGAVGLVAELALNWNYVTEQVTKFFKDNSGLIVGVSLALLVIGIILCFTGVGIPLAIGLIVVGAAGLAAEVALNWNYIATSITNFIKDNSGLIVGVSLALIVLGIILLFTGVGIPLAIGLIVAGGGALATTVALNWNFIVDKVKEVWRKVKAFWNEHIAPIFTIAFWKQLGIDMMNGLLSGIEGGINGIIKGFEKMINWIINGINKISFEIPDWLGGGKFGFDLPKVDFGEIKLPRLAKGTVLPGGKPFMAIVNDQPAGQTNIEAPLQTIVDAFNIALQNNGGGNTTKEEHYYLSETELMSVIYKLANGGKRLAGNSLIDGGAY